MKTFLAFLTILLLAADVEACGNRGRLFGRRHRRPRPSAACCQSETYYTYQTWSACGDGPTTLLPPAPRSPYAGEAPREKVEKIP